MTITANPTTGTIDAHVQGRLMEVDWSRRTALLHRFSDDLVPLRFEAALDDDMIRGATRFVIIRGRGCLNANDMWDWVQVQEIEVPRSWKDDLKGKEPKVFDPEQVVTASEPFDVDEFIRTIHAGRDAGREQRDHVPDEAALLYGWLKEVNWAQRTAQLHRYTGEYVRLRFEDALSDEMLRLATRYVEVRGRGRFNKDDSWMTVQVQQISEARSCGEPFDLEAFRNNPNPKFFDPDKVVTIDLTDEEWDSYSRAIREGREA